MTEHNAAWFEATRAHIAASVYYVDGAALVGPHARPVEQEMRDVWHAEGNALLADMRQMMANLSGPDLETWRGIVASAVHDEVMARMPEHLPEHDADHVGDTVAPPTPYTPYDDVEPSPADDRPQGPWDDPEADPVADLQAQADAIREAAGYPPDPGRDADDDVPEAPQLEQQESGDGSPPAPAPPAQQRATGRKTGEHSGVHEAIAATREAAEALTETPRETRRRLRKARDRTGEQPAVTTS